jgi:hypothetical protein
MCHPVTGNGDSRQIAEKLFVRLKTNKQNNFDAVSQRCEVSQRYSVSQRYKVSQRYEVS